MSLEFIKKESRFFYSPNFVLRPFIAGREDFLKVAFMAELNTQYNFKIKSFKFCNGLNRYKFYSKPSEIISSKKVFIKSRSTNVANSF